MFRSHFRLPRALFVLMGITLLLAMTATTVLADGAGPAITIKPVMAPRNAPPPIPHTTVLDRGAIEGYIAWDLRPQSVAANSAASAQGVSGKRGVLQTATSVATGINLNNPGNVCNDFNTGSSWQGEVWTSYFAGWGAFAADDGYYQAKNVTFDREQVVGPGNKFGKNEASMKIASNQPYDAGVMSPAIGVEPGDTVLVRVAYLIFNHDTKGRNYDYASMGIIPKLGENAAYVNGYQRGEWAILENEVQTTGDEIVVMLQGHSPDSLNSNIYFDNVQIYINDKALADCKG